jgi:hypothetical protein
MMGYINISITLAMKTVLFSSALSLIILSSCSSYRPASVEPDDRYFSLSDARKEQRQLKKLREESAQNTNPEPELSNYKRIQDATPDEQSAADPGNAAVINNYYEMDDYYDYMYASRLRRFHRPFGGFSYYNPFYTNMYWYNYDPLFFGTSIYTTYPFFNPFVPWGFNNWNPGWNFGWSSWSGFYMNHGWGGYNPWGWNNFGFFPHPSPFYYNPWACHPFGFGMGMGAWNNGFMHGYQSALFQQNFAFNQMYYNSFDQNTFVSPVVQKPNTGGFGAGANMIKTSPTLSQTLSKEIGMAPVSQVKTPSVVKPGTTGKTVQQNNQSGVSAVSGNLIQKGQDSQIKTGSTNPVQQINHPGNSGKESTGQPKNQADRYSSVKQAPAAGISTNDNKPLQPSIGINNAAPPSNVNEQKGRDGLIKSGASPAINQTNQYNSVPSQNNGANPGNVYQRQPSSAGSRDVNSNNLPQRSVQPYKPSYDYNQTLPAGKSPNPQIRQVPVNPGNTERQNQGQGEYQNRNYRQAPQMRNDNPVRSAPPSSPPINRAPSREYNKPQNSQPNVNPGRQNPDRNIRFQTPSGGQRQQPQQQARPINPTRSMDRAPSNNNIGGGNRSNQGGGQNQRIGTIRK